MIVWKIVMDDYNYFFGQRLSPLEHRRIYFPKPLAQLFRLGRLGITECYIVAFETPAQLTTLDLNYSSYTLIRGSEYTFCKQTIFRKKKTLA